MIQLAPGTKVCLACRPVGMRYGFDGLAAQASQVLGADPFCGTYSYSGPNADGKPDRRAWEVCVLSELRDQLPDRRGRVGTREPSLPQFRGLPAAQTDLSRRFAPRGRCRLGWP